MTDSIGRTTDHDLVIPQHMLPHLAGMIEGFDKHMENLYELGQVPGSFSPMIDAMRRVGEKIAKELENPSDDPPQYGRMEA